MMYGLLLSTTLAGARIDSKTASQQYGTASLLGLRRTGCDNRPQACAERVENSTALLYNLGLAEDADLFECQ